MNSQQLLFINFLIFAGLVLFFVLGRSKPKQGVRLNLKSGSSNAPVAADKAELPPVAASTAVPAIESQATVVAGAREVNQNPAKKTNVFFVYNGHEWEAHEVLGLMRDANLQTATSQYQNLIKTSDPSTFEFYDAAYSALLKSKKKS